MPHTLTLKNVSKKYQDKGVLRNIDMSGFNQKFLGIVGPAGSGKSTLLRLIAGLEDPTEGAIQIDGGKNNQALLANRHIEYVGFDVSPSWTVKKFLRGGLTQSIFPRPRREAQLDDIAKNFNLTSHLDQRLFQLSTSELHRTVFAKSLHSRAQILLLDSPLTSLDEGDRHLILSKLLQFKSQPDTMIIYAAHNLEEVASHADEVLILRSGGVEQRGSPQEIYDCPQNLFVAHMGQYPALNMLNCPIIHRDATQITIGVGGQKSLAIQCVGGVISSDVSHLIMGVRPHKVRLGTQGAISLQGVVVGFEETRGQDYMQISLGEESFFWVPYSLEKQGRLPALGSLTFFSFSSEDCLLFDAQGFALRRLPHAA
jgi:multiple sugar transport system ATP-binding protein